MKAEGIKPYSAGTAECFPKNNQIPIDVGDTCIVVGGSAFLDGKKIRTAWPSIHTSVPVALPTDIPFFREHDILVDEVIPKMNPLEFTCESVGKLATEMHLEIVENTIFRADGIRYRSLKRSDMKALGNVYEQCFGYPIAPDSILNLFTQTGGHLGGMFENEELIGFTTVLAAQLPPPHTEKSLFIDSVGIIPEKRKLKLGSFALQAVELAALDAGLTHVSLTHAEELIPFYQKNGYVPTSYLKDIYGPGVNRYYSVKKLALPQNV